MSRDLRAEGAVSLLSSASHGGEHAGTAQFLRREKIVQPDGTVAQIPIISGNSLRGILRDRSAQITWEQLGKPDLSTAVFHALWSGGTLAKAGSGNVLGSHQLRRLRQLVPHVSLFGCAGGGRIIEGRLMVGKLVPCCVETAHILPDDLRSVPLPRIWDMLQMEEFSRTDDSKRLSNPAVPLLPGKDEPPADGGAQGVLLEAPEVTAIAVEAAPEGPAQQMRYGVETLAAGSRFHWWMALRAASDLEVAQLSLTLSDWVASGSHMGGRSATGHGRLGLDMDRWHTPSVKLTMGNTLDAQTETPTDVGAHVRDHRDEIIESLGWLA